MSNYLGYILWYTVKGPGEEAMLDLSREQLEGWFAELELDKTYLPRSTKSIDAFRTATTLTGEPYVSDDGLRYQLAVIETRREIDLVNRVVMRRGLDPGAKTERVADLKYFRARRTAAAGRVQGSEDVKTSLHRGLRGVDRKVVQTFVDSCMARYERGRRQFTPHVVRALLRAYLTDLRGVPVPDTSGAYFVPMKALDKARALQRFASLLGEGSKIRLMPLVDDEEQRALLQEAIDADIEERARRTLAAISEWQDAHAGQMPGNRALARWYDQCRHLQTLLVDYGEQLDLSFPAAADSLESLHEATRQLTRRVMASSRRS